MAYVGTFSSPLKDMLPTQVDLPPGNGVGIHIFQVDRTTGAMTPAGIYESGTSPSCLALNWAGTHLYSANETDRVGENKEGTVSAFAINETGEKLELLNTVRSGGAGPTYVSIHPNGRFLLVANYFGGSVSVVPILADGRLGDASDIKNDAGQLGPTKATNAPPGSFAFSGSIGLTPTVIPLPTALGQTPSPSYAFSYSGRTCYATYSNGSGLVGAWLAI